MSKILNTSVASYYLEELLKDLDFKLYRDLTDEVSHIIRVSNDILDDKEKSRDTTARKAIQSQAEFRKGKFGDYFLWSKGLDLNKEPDSFTKKFIKAFL